MPTCPNSCKQDRRQAEDWQDRARTRRHTQASLHRMQRPSFVPAPGRGNGSARPGASAHQDRHGFEAARSRADLPPLAPRRHDPLRQPVLFEVEPQRVLSAISELPDPFHEAEDRQGRDIGTDRDGRIAFLDLAVGAAADEHALGHRNRRDAPLLPRHGDILAKLQKRPPRRARQRTGCQGFHKCLI